MSNLNKVIVWKSDSGISITYIDERSRIGNETDDSIIQRHIDRLSNVYNTSEPIIMDISNIPTDRSNRDKWIIDDDGLIKIKNKN